MAPENTSNPAENKYDVIVIGAGHNGLTTAALLAKQGRKVLILERRKIIGGLAAREEFHPGFHTPGVLHDASLFHPPVIEELKLRDHGLTLEDDPPSLFAPQHSGPGLLLHHDPLKSREEISKHHSGDAEQYGKYRNFLDSIRPFFHRLLSEIPPNIADGGLRSQLTMASTGLSLRRLGRDTMLEVLRIGPMCVADWLNEWFESELLKCLLAAPAFDASSTGPWSPATNAMLLRHEILSGPTAIKGPAAITSALEKACRSAGVEIRTDAEVKHIHISSGVFESVTLMDGEKIVADHLASSCDPKTLFRHLIENHDLPSSLTERMAHYRCLGTSVKVNLALDSPMRYACRPELDVKRSRIAETWDEMEQAFDATKYRQCPETPILDVTIPSLADDSLAPHGKHVVSILAHFVPYDLEGGWTNEARDTIGDRVVERLAQYAPDVTKRILAREVLTPVDIETRYGITGGHLHHGEHGLDQMITRPVPECARYATPIKGLILCGSGSHPGGGITGLPGVLAAQTIIG